MANRYSGKAIMTKAKAMNSRQLNENQYKELLRRESIDEIAAYLRSNTHYSAALQSFPERGISRLDLENRLRKDIFNSYLDIIRYDRSVDSFYRYVIVEMEIEQLIHCLRSLRVGKIESLIMEIPGFLIPYASFDFLKLASIRDFADMLGILRRTPYYTVLSPFHTDDGRPPDHLSCEAALQRYFAEHMLKLIASVPSREDRSRLKRYFSQHTELNNLNLMFRLKAFAAISPERARSYLVPLQGDLSPSEFNALLATDTQAAFLSRLRETSLGRRLGDLSATPLIGMTYFDLLTARLHYRSSRSLLRFATEGPSAFMALIMLNQIEIRNLITIIEGARYQIPADELEPLLIFN